MKIGTTVKILPNEDESDYLKEHYGKVGTVREKLTMFDNEFIVQFNDGSNTSVKGSRLEVLEALDEDF